MIEVYTHDAHLRLIGGYPSLYIDDSGLIYTKDEYRKAIGRIPCGKVDFARCRVYGRDYQDTVRTPISEFKRSGSQIAVYTFPRTTGNVPFLYIENGMIYTPDQFHATIGRQPAGYAKTVSSNGSSHSGKGRDKDPIPDKGRDKDPIPDKGRENDRHGSTLPVLPGWMLLVGALILWFVLKTAKFMFLDMFGLGGFVVSCIYFSIKSAKLGPVAHLERNKAAVARCKAKASASAAPVAVICGILWILTDIQWFTASGERTDLLAILMVMSIAATLASFFIARNYFYRKHLTQAVR